MTYLKEISCFEDDKGTVRTFRIEIRGNSGDVEGYMQYTKLNERIVRIAELDIHGQVKDILVKLD